MLEVRLIEKNAQLYDDVVYLVSMTRMAKMCSINV